jgi:pantetheine-phosphate adenylyltransferase
VANAVYPGSFDPVHNGHVDVIQRGSKVFDRLIVGVYDAPPKRLLFTTEERTELVRQAISDLSNVEVSSFDGLAVDFAREAGAAFILRGLRAGFDFETEFEMAQMWRSLAPDIDVVCTMSTLDYLFLHSSRIKEVAELGGEIEGFVPKHVVEALAGKFAEHR